MRDLGILLIHLLTTVVMLMGSGDSRAVIAESLRVKQQLVIPNRGRERAPNLRPMDRVVTGLCALLVRPARPDWSPGRQPLGKFRPRHPFPILSQASALRANLEHVARGLIPKYQFPRFWGRESEAR